MNQPNNVSSARSLGEPGGYEWFEKFATDLSEQDFSICPGALPPTVFEALSRKRESLTDADYSDASIGRRFKEQRNRFVRTNRVHWLLEEDDAISSWRHWSFKLRRYLNRHLYLGLESFESHIALYEPGDFYKLHIDAFRGERNRIISLVTYLNDSWQPGQGGELVLYPENGEPVRVIPEAGTVVLFLSEVVPHEVMLTNRVRHSVSGWFRVRSTSSLLDLPRQFP
ncbi:MAG: 2OG-Fe(II) oxygenase [Pseudomonadales bacterium]|jgi:SM-20-related protein|nr:2OG-Fe(II) oxygenase [Pseudomonadales bacterium]